MRDEGRKHVKLLNIERRRRQSVLQLHKQLSSFSLNCCFLASLHTALASMSISHWNESISFCPRERSSVRTHVRLTMNDLCINYMASYEKRKKKRFEVPLQHIRAMESREAPTLVLAVPQRQLNRSVGQAHLLVVIAVLRRLMVIENYVPSLCAVLH
jgi:hypothetical protein